MNKIAKYCAQQTELWQYLGDITKQLHKQNEQMRSQQADIVELQTKIRKMNPEEYTKFLQDKCSIDFEEARLISLKACKVRS